MRRRIISILIIAALLLALAAPAWADEALGERVDEWSVRLAEGAELSGASFWTGSDLRTEYLLTLAPGGAAVPVAVSGDPLDTQQTLQEAAATLAADGMRVLGGVNGGFYTVATGEPVGLAVSGGKLLHDDEGLRAVGFRADGSTVYGSPALALTLHAEESVYIISGYMRLTREESMAINWHMGGFDPRAQMSDDLTVAFTLYPNALLLHISDYEATYIDEKVKK